MKKKSREDEIRKPEHKAGEAADATAGGDGKELPLSKRKGRKAPRLVGLVVLVVLVIVLGIFGVTWIVDSVTFVSTEDAAIDGNHVNVSAKMLGRIKTIEASEGTIVAAGDLLVTLDDADFTAQAASASAALATARQNLVLSRVNLDRTRDDFTRTKSLYAGGAVTKEAYDHASRSLETAEAQFAISQAQVDAANAQLNIIATQIQNTRITAPINGTLAKKAFMPGDVVQPGQAIFVINDLKNVWVIANFEETKISRIAVGAEVEIAVDAYPDYAFRGRVERITGAIVPPAFSIGEFTKTTQRIPIRISFTNLPEGYILLPGMSVVVKVRSK